MITARDRPAKPTARSRCNFYGPNAELRSWDVIDATGARTRITLSDVTQPASFDRSLFRLEDMLEQPRAGRALNRARTRKFALRWQDFLRSQP